MAEVTDMQWKSKRGTPVEVSVHRPAGGGDTAVVIAPGRAYARGGPLLVRCAEMLADSGCVAIRFDWAYTADGKDPEPDLSNELDDLGGVVRAAADLDGVRKVVVVGKSMGAIVAAAYAALDPSVAGVALLTPPLARGGDAVPWPGLRALGARGTPVLIAAGDADPVCPLDALATFAGHWSDNCRVCVLPGDHSFNWADGGEFSIEGVAACLASWADRLPDAPVGKSPIRFEAAATV